MLRQDTAREKVGVGEVNSRACDLLACQERTERAAVE